MSRTLQAGQLEQEEVFDATGLSDLLELLEQDSLVSYTWARNTEQRRRDALLFIEPSVPLAQRRLKHLAINAPDSADDNEYKILEAWWSGKRSLDCQAKN